MDIPSLLMVVALTVLVVAIVMRPLLMPQTEQQMPTTEIDDLLVRREQVLSSLRDLDFDYSTGKINDEDYTRQRERLMQTGVAVLKQLDQMGVTAPGEMSSTASLDAGIEALLAKRRGGPATPQAAAPSAGDHCPACGAAVVAGDRFCARCGQTLAVEEAG